MKGLIKYVFWLLACPVFGQAVVFTAGVNYTSGAPTHNPGKANSRVAIDTVTWIRYEHVIGTTWTATGYAWQEHSGCTDPSATPTKHESIYKTNTCSPPKMYKWTGAAWEEMGYGTGVVITANNGLYKPTTSSVRAGGPLVENTNINGKATYTLTLDSMYLVTIKANRTSGTGASRMTMGSTNLIGVDIVHYNTADLDNIGQITANFNTGNIMSLANGSLITSFTQYLSGGNYRSEWYASNGSSNRVLELGYNDFKIKYLERQGIADNTAIVTWDSITGELLYQSPDILASIFGDNWGGQTVSSTARFSGNGTSGSPLELAQQSATSGQVLKWSGSAWAPGTDASGTTYTAENGTYLDGTILKLGAPLTENTAIDGAGFTLGITDASNITLSATGSFGITSTLSVDEFSSSLSILNGSTESLFSGNGTQSFMSHENNSTGATARVLAENYRKIGLQYYPTGGTPTLEYFLDGGATVPGHYQVGMRYKSSGDTILATDATTGEVRRRPLIVTPAQITNGTTGSFLRSGASVPAWETAASLQGSLLLPSGTSTQTLRHNGSAWVANSILANDGAFIGIGTTSPSSILDIRRPGNDAFLNLTGYDAKIKVGGTLGGNQTYSAQFVLESENAGVREVITEIVPSTRSTALYRYYGAEVTNSYTGYDGVVRCNPSAYPFYQRMWAAGGQFDIGVILRTDGQTFTYTDMAPYMTVRSSGNVGIGQESPAQKLDVNGTVRIVGSSGTATGLMGRDADGDVSGVGLSVGLEFSGSNIQVDVGSGLNVSGNSIAWGGTLTENTTQDFDTYDVFFTNMPTSTTEDEALVIDSGTGKLARGQIPITAIRNPGEATYLGDNGGTGETVTWQPEDILVEADPTAGHLTVELNTSMKQGLAYSLFGCCNLTYNITLNSGTMKITGSYGTTSSYVLGAGEHLEVIRMSSNTFYISKK